MYINWIVISVVAIIIFFSILFFLKTNKNKTEYKNTPMPENIVKYYKTALFSNH
jgi:hypothetical protein